MSTAVHASVLPCTANPDAFTDLVGATSLVGRARIIAAQNACHRCPIEAACREDVRNWPEAPRRTVVGGMFYDYRARERPGPPPLNPYARSTFAAQHAKAPPDG